MTGAESGIFVVDVDVKGGKDGYAELEHLSRGELPRTFTVRTGSGGAHFYFRHPGFRVANIKPADGIDIKGDKERDDGLVYVVGPGSPGYVRTDDPCVVESADPYEVVDDTEIADAPEWLRLVLDATTRKAQARGEVPVPIDETNPDWEARIRLAEKICKEAPAQADGSGGVPLLNVAIRLVRVLELPLETAHALVVEHFNPRATNKDGSPWAWEDADIWRKLEEARDRCTSVPCGDALPVVRPSQVPALEKLKEHGKPPAQRLTDANIAASAPEPSPEGKTKSRVTDARKSSDLVKQSTDDLVRVLHSHPDWEAVLWFDVHLREPIAFDPPIDGGLDLQEGQLSRRDVARIKHWCILNGMSVTSELVEDAIGIISGAPDRQRNVLAEYLDSLTPVTEAKILPTLATASFGADDPFANTLMMKALVAAALRARKPGAPHKGMLVLHGAQGIGKTPACKILGGPFYHSLGKNDIADDMTLMACRGKLIVEVEEMSALKRDQETLKATIAFDADVLNVKYERHPKRYPRSWVPIATTNKPEFLADATGDSRYWVVRCGKVDLARLEALRDQIWAEADFLARTMPERWNFLTDEEQAHLDEGNAQHRKTPPLMSKIVEGLRVEASVVKRVGRVVVDVTKAWETFCKGFGTPSTQEQEQIETSLQLLGFKHMSKKAGVSAPRIGQRRPHSWWEADASGLAKRIDPDDALPASRSDVAN